MALLALLAAAAHAALGTDVQALYRELTEGPKKGSFVLDVTAVDGFELDDVAGLKSAVGATRAEKETAETQAREALAKSTTLQARVTELEAFDPNVEADKLAGQKFESLKTQLGEQHATELKTAVDLGAVYLSGLRTAMIDAEAITAITTAKGSVKLLKSAVTSQCKLKETQGADGTTIFTAEVIDGAGAPRIRDAQANPFTISDLVEEMAKDPEFAPAFSGEEASGAGRTTTTGTPAASQPAADGTPTSKIESGLNQGLHQVA